MDLSELIRKIRILNWMYEMGVLILIHYTESGINRSCPPLIQVICLSENMPEELLQMITIHFVVANQGTIIQLGEATLFSVEDPERHLHPDRVILFLDILQDCKRIQVGTIHFLGLVPDQAIYQVQKIL